MPVRVATLNIWNRLGPWDERLHAIREGVSAESPDVLALQEVVSMDGFDQAALVAEGFGYHLVQGRHTEAMLPIGNAILSRYPVLRHEVLDLPTGGTVERRTLVHAVLDTPFGKMPVFVTHLNWKLDEGHVRELQVRFIADTLARLYPAEAEFPPVLMGDFNAEPDADEIRFLRGLTSLGGARAYFADAWAYAGEGPGVTFARRNPFAAPMREPDRRIDYIFTRTDAARPGRGEPVEAHVAFDAPRAGVFPSDHFGVVATLST
jgi:endonuclease/exonuclease/phosphatase family metal-dependent hydrolase